MGDDLVSADEQKRGPLQRQGLGELRKKGTVSCGFLSPDPRRGTIETSVRQKEHHAMEQKTRGENVNQIWMELIEPSGPAVTKSQGRIKVTPTNVRVGEKCWTKALICGRIPIQTLCAISKKLIRLTMITSAVSMAPEKKKGKTLIGKKTLGKNKGVEFSSQRRPPKAEAQGPALGAWESGPRPNWPFTSPTWNKPRMAAGAWQPQRAKTITTSSPARSYPRMSLERFIPEMNSELSHNQSREVA